MTRSYAPGELRIAVLGDLLRNPATDAAASAKRLDVSDPHTVRVTLARMVNQGWVRRLSSGGWMLTGSGLRYIGQVRGWLEAQD